MVIKKPKLINASIKNKQVILNKYKIKSVVLTEEFNN